MKIIFCSSKLRRWFRHIQEAQEAYTAREGRNRRTHPHTPLQDPDDSTPTSSDALRDVDDGVEVDGGEAADTTAESLVDSKIQPQQGAAKSLGSSGRIEELPAPAIPAQPPASPETLLKKTGECLVAPCIVVHGSGGTTKCLLSSHYEGSDQKRVVAVQVVMVNDAEW
ncbi:hypothetical protein E2C01_030139 [Portunus trituberculatus]|uniref:Uncharacterized protein n=1 Tax=Portunus trituberculatus TaxID=210409 RepID=A0A5B7EQ50_PORTR|nr:hypothetical protein [Portunus trituberculatus]